MLLIVTGMRREAARFGSSHRVIIAGGNPASLGAKIDAAFSKEIRGIISLGIAGGLSPYIGVGSKVVATEIRAGYTKFPVDGLWQTALLANLSDAVAGAITGSGEIVSSIEHKAELHRASGSLAVDMESHIAAERALTYGLPFAALRAISDSFNDVLPPAALNAIDEDGNVRIGSVLGSVARRPNQLPALIRTGQNTSLAMKNLLRCLDRLGSSLACPYLG